MNQVVVKIPKAKRDDWEYDEQAKKYRKQEKKRREQKRKNREHKRSYEE